MRATGAISSSSKELQYHYIDSGACKFEERFLEGKIHSVLTMFRASAQSSISPSSQVVLYQWSEMGISDTLQNKLCFLLFIRYIVYNYLGN
jgi:hypothetical protein